MEDVEEEVEELAREEWEDESGDHIRKTAAKQQSHRPPTDKLRCKNSLAQPCVLLLLFSIFWQSVRRHC